jgi:hypothetical protein
MQYRLPFLLSSPTFLCDRKYRRNALFTFILIKCQASALCLCKISITTTMPWLSRRNSAEEATKPVNQDPKSGVKTSACSMVNFIPAQIDGLCGTIPAHHKVATLGLVMDDLRVLIQNISCLSAMAKAACSANVLRSLFKNPADARDTILQLCLASIQVCVLAIALPAFLSLPGFLFIGLVNGLWALTLAMTWPLSGPRVLISEREKAPMIGEFSDERWIYVNGMMCR